MREGSWFRLVNSEAAVILSLCRIELNWIESKLILLVNRQVWEIKVKKNSSIRICWLIIEWNFFLHQGLKRTARIQKI